MGGNPAYIGDLPPALLAELSCAFLAEYDPLTLRRVWHPIPGYEGYYEVGDKGLVRALSRTILRSNGDVVEWSGRNLRAAHIPRGGWAVSLSISGKTKTFTIRRLIKMATGRDVPETSIDALYLSP